MARSFAGVPSVHARRSQHVLIGGALLTAAAASWIELIRGAGMDPGVDAGLFVGMWLAMVGAMMLPTIEPMVVAHFALTRPLPGAVRAARTAAFVVPYLLLWSSAGVLALALRTVALDRPVVGAALIAAAGLYQLGALKEACLRSCRSPLSFFLRYGESAGSWAGTLRLGLRHAALCFGCCVGLMVALVGAGAIELTWMAALGLLMLLEKVHPYGQQLSRAAGVALLALAPATLVVPMTGSGAQLSGLVALGVLALVALASVLRARIGLLSPTEP